jgi:2'-5' RNA ligase
VETKNQTKRIFTAIIPPKSVRLKLSKLIEDFLDFNGIEGVSRVIPSENLHITLDFYGEVGKGEISDLVDNLESLSNKVDQFSLKLNTIKLGFPSREYDRVILATVKPKQPLLRLKTKTSENKKFYPHITLAKLDNKRLVKEVTTQDISLEFSVDKVFIISSELKSAGSVYTQEHSFSL